MVRMMHAIVDVCNEAWSEPPRAAEIGALADQLVSATAFLVRYGVDWWEAVSPLPGGRVAIADTLRRCCLSQKGTRKGG